VAKNSKTISHFCGLFGWLLSQLRVYKIFKKKKPFFYIDWKFGKFGGKEKTREKEKENQDNAWSAHYFILFSIV
jgi:hypothetical protein